MAGYWLSERTCSSSRRFLANFRRCGDLLPRIDNRDTVPADIPVVSGDEHQIVMQGRGRQQTVDHRQGPALFGGHRRQRAPSLRNPLVYG